MKLKTLDGYNQTVLHHWNTNYITHPKKNGIECPQCKANGQVVELLDSAPLTVLTSNPPRKSVHCEKCKFVGFKYV